MGRNLNRSKRSYKIVSLVLTVLFSISFFSVVADARQMMNGVPQEVGFEDVPFSKYKESGCRDCHGASVVAEHHSSKIAVAGQCAVCHGPSATMEKVALTKGAIFIPRKDVTLMRDCLDCHKKSPHHLTEAANQNKCGECHDEGVAVFNSSIPKYEASLVTPTVQSCRNCHSDSTKKFTKGKRAGQVINTSEFTHHGTGIKRCNICHSENKSDPDIRLCERCHSREILHAIPKHVEPKNCVGCHYKVTEQSTAKVPASTPAPAPTPAQ